MKNIRSWEVDEKRGIFGKKKEIGIF